MLKPCGNAIADWQFHHVIHWQRLNGKDHVATPSTKDKNVVQFKVVADWQFEKETGKIQMAMPLWNDLNGNARIMCQCHLQIDHVYSQGGHLNSSVKFFISPC